MKNFIFKSIETDLQKMFSILETIQKNVLYLTYRIDTLTKDMKSLTTDKGLQKQVDEYFEDIPSFSGNSTEMTSPQTDTDEQ